MATITLNLDPGRRVLFQFGLVALVAFCGAGWLCLHWGGLFGFDFGDAARPVAWALFGLGILSGIFSMVRPELNQPIYAGLTLVTYPIGLVVSTALMVVLFFVVITPMGLLLRILGRDLLRQRRDPEAETYWTVREGSPPPERYFRQF